MAKVTITGNKRIEAETITVAMKTKPGEYLDPALLDGDLKTIFRMGYFADLRAYTQDTPEGEEVVIELVENPGLREIEVKGKGSLDDDEVLEAFSVQALTVYSGQAVANGLERVADLYREKGYLNVEVTSRLDDVEEGMANLIIEVQPGDRVYIQDVEFAGNEKISDKTLRKQMETKDWSIFSFLTSAGVLEQEALDKDVEKIRAYYQDHGFLKAQVGDPRVDIEKDGITITVPIEEGDQYTISRINLSGDLIESEEKLGELMSLKAGQVYARSQMEIDRAALGEFYASRGYARVRVATETEIESTTKQVVLAYKIGKGDEIFIEHVYIRGNTRTRDKVIRRQMKIKEGDLYDVTKLRRSAFNLRRLQYFEEVDFKNMPGSALDEIDLHVSVKEQPTGALNFGIGYSTQENLIFMANVSEKNLFGRGQELSVRGTWGAETKRYSVNFVEPWLFDLPLRWSSSVFDNDREYTDYDKHARGGWTKLSYPVWGDDVRAWTQYLYESVELTNIDDDASLRILDVAGWHSTSSIAVGLVRDTRDVYFNTSSGSRNQASVEYAGLGGTNAFTKYLASSGWFIPLFWNTTLSTYGKIGYVVKNSGGKLPLYEKFYLGGINSLRGYDFASISPKDPLTGERIGGEKMLQFNFEFIFPLLMEQGIKGLFFFDAGNVWSEDSAYDLGDLRFSAGTGIRWYSPVGPLRLEYGWVLNGEEDDPTGGWAFSIGTIF